MVFLNSVVQVIIVATVVMIIVIAYIVQPLKHASQTGLVENHVRCACPIVSDYANNGSLLMELMR